MDPKTRQEKKKDQRKKAQGLNGKYSAKHVRLNVSLAASETLRKF